MFPEVIAAVLLGAGPAEFKKVEETDGVLIEARPVEGAKVVELRLTTTASKRANALCDAAFGDGKFDAEEPDLKSRKIVSESEDERVTYEQISPPVVANRDYAVRAKRTHEADGSCRMTFAAANDLAPESPRGWVRVTKLWGEWRFEPQPDGKTRVTYMVFSDPAGAVPPFMVEGARRKLALKWVKMIITRAKD